MATVKLVARTLDLFALYARKNKALTLTELAQGLDAPMSSTLGLIRTLINKGYLYQTAQRTYYPTRRLLLHCQIIANHDPIIELLHPYLLRLKEESGETAVAGKQEHQQIIYLDVVHSDHAIRYMAQAGDVRSLHANSLGKALLSVLNAQALSTLIKKLDLTPITDQTLTTTNAILSELEQSRQRGWASNISESVPDLAAIAAPVYLGGQWYAFSIVGPILRMRKHWDHHVHTLLSVVRDWKHTTAHNGNRSPSPGP